MTIDPPRKFPAFSLHGQMYVHIIESPSPADLLDGRTEGKVLRESLKLAGIPTSYNLARDRATFESAMGQRVYEAVRAFEAYPILHFSMHGNEQGLELTNGDFLAWQELAGHIRGLEPKPRSGVIVSMSACYGAFARQMAMTSQSPPYSRLVGHPGNLDWADAAVAFTAFYHRLFKGVSHFQIAVEAMRAASGDEAFGQGVGFEDQEVWQHFASGLADALSEYLPNQG